MADFTGARSADELEPGRDYPSDLAELRAWFPTDAECLDYLDWLRWPNGFCCPHCESRSAGRDSVGRYRCRGCWRRVSVTSGTIFDKTRVPLTVWFEVVWLVTSSKTGVPAAHLHRVLPIASYQTAWAMLARLRQVMTSAEGALLSGRVEVDETFIGGPRPGVRGRGARGKTLVAGAIEINDTGWGRARMAVIDDATTASLKAFAAKTIAPESIVVTDGLNSYPSALQGYEHQAISVAASGRPAHESLPAVHRLFSLAKRTLEGTYQGAGTAGHLPEYLDEFIFRFNRRNSRHRGLVFLRLLQRSVDAPPVTYRDLVRDSQPKKTRPQGRTGPCSKPGSLDQAISPRPWRRSP